jgi:hypothetical protein
MDLIYTEVDNGYTRDGFESYRHRDGSTADSLFFICIQYNTLHIFIFNPFIPVGLLHLTHLSTATGFGALNLSEFHRTKKACTT